MRRTVLAAALLPCALALSSCASSTPAASSTPSAQNVAAGGANNAGLTQTQLVTRMRAALTSATALHIKGTMTDNGQSTVMDMQLNANDSAQGTLEVADASMPMIVVNGVTYLQFTPSYVQMIEKDGGAASDYLTQYENKWVSSQSPAGASLTSFAGQISFKQMTGQMIANAQQTYTYLDTGTLNGQQVARYRDVDKQSGTATIAIPLTGLALPIQLDTGSQGTLTFVWNQPTTVTAPPAAQVAVVNLPTS